MIRQGNRVRTDYRRSEPLPLLGADKGKNLSLEWSKGCICERGCERDDCGDDWKDKH